VPLLYNDEEGNLNQEIVFYLVDSKGNPVTGLSENFYIGLSWQSPQIREIAKGVYKIFGGRLAGNNRFFPG